MRRIIVTGLGLALVLGGLSGCTGTERTSAESRPATPPPTEANPSTAGHGMDHSSASSMGHLKALSGAAFDAAFLSQMIEHHQGALEMSQSYLPEGKRPELKAMARTIIQDQKREIGQMTEWTRAWTAQEPDPELRRQMKAEMMPMMTAFKADCRSDCDRAFLVHMRMHHQMAVEMARMVPERSSQPKLKQLAEQIIASQSAEMAKFDAWLKEWYSEAGHSGSGH